jgi:hypothetical protein
VTLVASRKLSATEEIDRDRPMVAGAYQLFRIKWLRRDTVVRVNLDLNFRCGDDGSEGPKLCKPCGSVLVASK